MTSQQLAEQIDPRVPAVARWAAAPLIASCLLVMIDGYDMFMISFLAPLISSDLHLSPLTLGRVFTAGLAGSMVGGIVIGPVADRVGRKRALVASLLLAALGTILCARAESSEAFAVYRFVSGFALGGVLAAIVPLVAEHFSPERRNAVVTLMFVGYPLGAVIGGGVTALLYFHGWRQLFVGTAALLLIAVSLTLLMRETLNKRETTNAMQVTWRNSLFGPFAEGRLLASIFLGVGIFCMLLVAYLLTSWTPMIAVRSGIPPRAAALCGVFLNLGGVAGALASTVLVRKFGVFRLVALMIATGAVSIALVGQFFGSIGVLCVSLFVSGALAIGGQQNTPAMSVELYPQHVRAAGAGWSFSIGRVGSMFGPLLGGYLLSVQTDPKMMFFMMAIPTGIAAVAYLLVDLVKPN
ncbi:MFS transporter [Paraburkholderia sediminicola]|uniref:MFS transporter n=1 Tax=Paraburkholderia sediminicola TaxID=458836 RepID=UPI0038BCFB43